MPASTKRRFANAKTGVTLNRAPQGNTVGECRGRRPQMAPAMMFVWISNANNNTVQGNSPSAMERNGTADIG